MEAYAPLRICTDASVGGYVCVQGVVISLQRVVHERRPAAEDEVGQVARLFAADGHGADAAYAGDDHVAAGHLGGAHPLELLYALRGDVPVEVVAAADGFLPAEPGLDDVQVHLPEEAAHGVVHLRLAAEGAGVVYGDSQPAVVGQLEPGQGVEHLPVRDRTDARIELAEAAVAAGAVVGGAATALIVNGRNQ